jgi:methionyl-tRNA synthetase
MSDETPTGLIDIETFSRVQLRTAEVVECTAHPRADRLLRLQVDIGGERRQIVAGIAEAYRPDELVGRTIVVVTNLQPAKLRGEVSEGMLLAATGPDGRPALIGVDGEIAPGAKVS